MSHTGYWPRMQRPRHRQLAIVEAEPDGHGHTRNTPSYRAFLANGTLVERGMDYAAVRDLCCERGVDAYCGGMLRNEYLSLVLAATQDRQASVLASARGGVLGIAWRARAGRTGCLGQAHSWGAHAATPAFLGVLNALYGLFGVGEYPTPAALGEALWRASRSATGARAVPCPNMAARRALLAHVIGGRADTPPGSVGTAYATAYESDLRSAYPALACSVPSGTACRVFSEEGASDAFAYFVRCRVSVSGRVGCRTSPVPLGTAVGATAPRVTAPHTWRVIPGEYDLWLWSSEVAACRAVGFTVAAGSGWAWRHTDTASAGWLAALTHARGGAPDATVARLVKLAGVAAIGRHGARDWGYRLVDDAEADTSRGDTPLCALDTDSGGATGPLASLWLRREPNQNAVRRLPHWYSYILAECRIALWRRLEAEAAAGNRPLLSNFDALLTEGPPTQPTSDADMPGTWKLMALHDVEIRGPRSYASREKGLIAPGVPRLARGT